MSEFDNDLTQPIQTITELGLGSAGSQLDLLADPSRYAMGDELARGGMGMVLNARDVKLHRNVAIKKLLEPAKNSELAVRFVHEAQVTGQLEHPGIVPVYELGLDDQSQPFYTMKFIRGQPLGDILEQIKDGDAATIAKYSLNRLLAIFLKACDAIAFAHSRQVIHRDLKPANLMIGDFGEVLVVDWGLAKVIDPSSVRHDVPTEDEIPEWVIESIRDSESGSAIRTVAGQLMGTPAYMAPEQARGNPDMLDSRTDVYALGAILYVILTLEKPIQGRTIHALLLNVVQGKMTAPEAHSELPHCPGGVVPRPLAAVVKKAMHVQPQERYASAQALQGDIQAYLDGFATEAEDANLWQLTKLFAARHKGIVALCAIFAILAVGFVSQIVASERKARANATLAVQHAAESAEHAQRANEALDELRGAVPTFVTYAQSQVKDHAFEDAAATLRYALTLAPQHALALELNGNILQVLGQYEASTAAYQKLAGPQAERNIALNTSLGAEPVDNDRLLQLHAALLEQERLYEAGFTGSKLKLASEAAMGLWMPIFEASELVGKMTPADAGRINLHLHGKTLGDIESLRGMPIGLLHIEIPGLEHLAPPTWARRSGTGGLEKRRFHFGAIARHAADRSHGDRPRGVVARAPARHAAHQARSFWL